MSDQNAKPSWRYSTRVGCVVVPLLLLLATYFMIKNASERAALQSEAAAKECVRQKIADVKNGNQHTIDLSNEFSNLEMSEFVKAHGELTADDDYRLRISYSHDADNFLRQIHGLRGIKSLSLYKTDISDAGMESITSMPELKELSIARAAITDAGIRVLAESVNLESLYLSLRRANGVTVPTILALPHLRKLTLSDYDEEGEWPFGYVSELEQAHSLNELTLIGTVILPDELKRLQNEIPNCKITVQAHH